MLKTLFLSAFLLFVGVQTGHGADTTSPLCPGSRKSAVSNPLLWQALKAAYPSAKEVRGRAGQFGLPCIFPYKAISYENFVVLITLADVPGRRVTAARHK